MANDKMEGDKMDSDKIVPKALALNDDTYLEKTALVDGSEALGSKLRTIDQCILLSYWYERDGGGIGE